MSNQPLEIILSRQFADSLNIAAFIVDPEGNLIFYNEPAEKILGVRFSETGSMPVEEWSTAFTPTDILGNTLNPDDLPLVQTLKNQKPAHGSIYISSKTYEKHLITITSIPIIGRTKIFSGAIAIFWIPDA